MRDALRQPDNANGLKSQPQLDSHQPVAVWTFPEEGRTCDRELAMDDHLSSLASCLASLTRHYSTYNTVHSTMHVPACAQSCTGIALSDKMNECHIYLDEYYTSQLATTQLHSTRVEGSTSRNSRTTTLAIVQAGGSLQLARGSIVATRVIIY